MTGYKQRLYDELAQIIGELELHELLYILRRRSAEYQYDVAKNIKGMSPGRYSHIEKGNAELTEDEAKQLLEILPIYKKRLQTAN